MITEEEIYRIEEDIIESSSGLEDFLQSLIESKSQLALWLTSENFELFTEQEFASLAFVCQVLIESYQGKVEISKIEAEEIAATEEELYQTIQSKGRLEAQNKLFKADLNQRQPHIYNYIEDYLSDVQETYDLDKAVYDAYYVSIMTLFSVLEKNKNV